MNQAEPTRRYDLEEEIGGVFGYSGIEVYEDLEHGCLRVKRDGYEIYSCLLPFDGEALDDMRHHAYIMLNDLGREEERRVKDAMDRMEEQQKIEEEQLIREVTDETMERVYRGRILGVLRP